MKKLSPALALLASLICFSCALAQTNANATASPSASPTPTPLSLSPATWSPELQVAVFTSVFGVATGLVSFFWGWLQKKKAQRAESTIATANKSLANELVNRIGHKIGALIHTVNISDADGTLKLGLKWQDVQLARQDAVLGNIPGSMKFIDGVSKFKQPPDIPYQTFARPLNLVTLNQTDSSSEYQIEITGGLNFGEQLTFECTAEIEKAFYMTREEVEANAPSAFKKEFQSFGVVRPVDRLEINITFPEGYTVDTFPGVCIGDVLSDKYMHNEELERITKNQWFRRSSNSANLRVDEPIVGFTYLIYWVPPPKRLVDHLRQPTV